MSRIKIFLWIIIALCTDTVHGQLLKFEEVTLLPASINSDAEESMPIIESDGKTMYFVRSFYKDNHGGKFAGQDIWVCRRDTAWTLPTNDLKILNNKRNNAVIGIKDDGETLYLLNSYGSNVHGIAFTKFISGKWTKPENIPIKGISKDGYIGYFMNSSYEVLLISMRRYDSYGQEDIYVSLKDSLNRWGDPINLGATINSAGFEISPFLSKDKKYLFFASNGHLGFGDADIFVSERLYDSWDIWTSPRNLGPFINTKYFDAYFTLAEDSTVYFVRNNSNEYSNLYQSKLIVETQEQQAKNELLEEADRLLTEMHKLSGDASIKNILFFNYNQIELDTTEINKISTMLTKTTDLSNLKVSIELFSFEGNRAYITNQLIKKRAEGIKNEIINYGINEDQIVVYPFNRTNLEALASKHPGGAIIEIRSNAALDK